jgi:hypothetical protein
MKRCALVALAAGATILAAGGAHADTGGRIVVWPTLTPAGDDASPVPLHKPSVSDRALVGRAQELDATLRDAAADLGFTLDVADPGPAPGHARDSDIVERAAKPRGAANAGTWVVSARLEPSGGDSFVERIVAVPPNGRELRVRVETVKDADVSVRGLVMLRDLLSPAAAALAEATERERERVDTSAQLGIVSPLRSPGRAVLAVNAALFGGYTAYSIQRSSGSTDPRVLYPLLALGTGVGIGGALLVSDEWDVGTGDAWYLAAGAWWGVVSGVLITDGLHVQPLTDRYAWGIGTGLGGLALSTFALTRKKMDEGGAVLAHSGAALGLFVGGVAELAYRGSTTGAAPYTGGGYGTAIGLVGAGAMAVWVQTSPSRVLLVDLGAGLGALAGTAAGSPLIFNDTSQANTRGFLAATLGGTVVGGVAAWWLTRDSTKTRGAAWLGGQPTAGIIGQSMTTTGAVPVYGAGWQGSF